MLPWRAQKAGVASPAGQESSAQLSAAQQVPASSRNKMKHPSCANRRICQEFANGRALTIGQFRTQQRTERWGEVHYGDSPVQFARRTFRPTATNNPCG